MLVSNTSTLVLLAKAQCLEEFISVSPRIHIPEQVRIEALFKINSYDAKLIAKLIQMGKIKMVTEKVDIQKIMQEFRLHEGEAAAYAHYIAGGYDAVLTDDGELIKLCKLENIPFICAMAVVIRLFEKGILTKAESLKKLQGLHDVGRYSEKLYLSFKEVIEHGNNIVPP